MVRTRHSHRGGVGSSAGDLKEESPPAEAGRCPEKMASPAAATVRQQRTTRGTDRRGGAHPLQPIVATGVRRTRNCSPLPLYTDQWEGERPLKYATGPFRSARPRRAIQLPARPHRYNVEFTEIEVRRSGRKRKMMYDNFSDTWITTQIAHSRLREGRGAKEAESSLPAKSSASPSPSPPPSLPPSPPAPTPGERSPPAAGSPARQRRSSARRILLPPLEDDGMDMYSRVKRIHRPAQRFGCASASAVEQSRGFVLADSSSGDATSSDEDEDEPSCADQPDDEPRQHEPAERLRSATRSMAKSPRADSKVIKKYYLREKRSMPTFYQDESLLSAAARPELSAEPFPGHRWHRCHRRRQNAAFNGSTTDSSSGRDSGDDQFERRKARSMQGFRNKCLPMNFTKADATQRAAPRQRVGTSLADVDPMTVDKDVNFDMIGGLRDHIRDLKEMILLPLLYPEVFSSKNITPPKGVLFCGPPGTGKTLMARALANECNLGDRKVAFFMRKGADVLSKWVGESERQLRLLFDQAYQMRPSIIFFDEVDGLAPVRSSKQDYIHSSIVSTLLALMDGVDSRGEVIVIGATNRPDSVDPALRRPGRFDREFYFPLPPLESREQILRIQLAAWRPPVLDATVCWLARQTAGYCGADLKHLVTEAVLHALRERYPQIYRSKRRLLIDVDSIQVLPGHFRAAMGRMTPAGQRDRTEERRLLPAAVRPLLTAPLAAARAALCAAFPFGYKRATELSRSDAYMPRLLLAGRQGQCHTEYLAPALLYGLENVRVFTFNAFALHGTGAEPLQALAQLLSEAARSVPAVVYLPRLDSLWMYLAERLGLREPLLNLLDDLPRRSPLLLLATCNLAGDDGLPPEVANQFSAARGQIHLVDDPKAKERHKLFTRLFMKTAILLKKRKQKEVEEELPVAPPPPPRQLSEAELRKTHRREERRLAELRIFLREMCGRLIRNRQFELFRQPVDEEDAPDYYSIIERPMDLDTIMTRIDQHRYEAAEDFLADVDQICTNALEYNPDTTEIGREIRHRACMMRDQSHKLIDEQMDSDFEEECRAIRQSRRERAESPSKFAPRYLVTPRSYLQQMASQGGSSGAAGDGAVDGAAARPPSEPTSPGRRKQGRRPTRWSRGVVAGGRRRASRLDTDRQQQQQQLLSGELDLACPAQHVAHAKQVAKPAPPDEDSGHGSTTAPGSDEQLASVAAGVQVDRGRLLLLCERAVKLTAGWSVAELEELHDRLVAVVRRFHYRRQRNDMLKEMETILESI